ncbi:MAG TPA: hypothetical protein ENI09_00030, partial [candidate division WWE3 bacterium]|nr:hypothetical protein [candidate division WWE3 bacterium]
FTQFPRFLDPFVGSASVGCTKATCSRNSPRVENGVATEEMEEERRLCYVGMTRAKRHLHLCFAKDRMFFGTRSFSAPSRFLTEIGSRDVVFHLPQESFGQ